MKKILLLILVFAPFLSQSLLAQSFRYGVKGGVNYSDINGKELDKNSHRYKLGWHAGVMVNIQYPGTKFFSIQPELIYSRKGYENFSLPYELKDSKGNVTLKVQNAGLVRLNYLDLPVMFNFRSGIIVFELGPQFSALVGVRDESVSRQEYANGTTIISPNQQFERQGVSKLDLGLATGFRLETENGAALGIRFNQGLVRLKNNVSDIPVAPKGYNQSFQIFASYLIPE